MKFSSVLVLTCLSLACALASAQPSQDTQRSGSGQHGSQGQQGQQGQGPANGGHRPPPAEALAACKSLASGAACSFTAPRGAESGTCFAPEGKPLACRPQRGTGGTNQAPSQGKPKS